MVRAVDRETPRDWVHLPPWSINSMSMVAAQVRPALRCIVQSLRPRRATRPSLLSVAPIARGTKTPQKQKSAASIAAQSVRWSAPLAPAPSSRQSRSASV